MTAPFKKFVKMMLVIIAPLPPMANRGTFPFRKRLSAGAVPVNKKHLSGTLKKIVFSQKYPNTLEVPLSAAPKVPEFCPEIEGNSEPRGEPVVCNIATLATKLSLLGWESK